MPYPGIPASLTGKMERCVGKVMKTGKSKSSAIAICHDSVMGKELPTEVTDDALKQLEQDKSIALVEKQDDGRYKIITVSTAALPDKEDEVFSIKAIDYDIALAESTGSFPEYMMFHRSGLAFGKVTAMSRVGIFAVDVGYSYTDPFSISVCEKMLSENADGKWKVSRGFVVLEVLGGCPACSEELVILSTGKCSGRVVCKDLVIEAKGILNAQVSCISHEASETEETLSASIEV